MIALAWFIACTGSPPADSGDLVDSEAECVLDTAAEDVDEPACDSPAWSPRRACCDVSECADGEACFGGRCVGDAQPDVPDGAVPFEQFASGVFWPDGDVDWHAFTVDDAPAWVQLNTAWYAPDVHTELVHSVVLGPEGVVMYDVSEGALLFVAVSGVYRLGVNDASGLTGMDFDYAISACRNEGHVTREAGPDVVLSGDAVVGVALTAAGDEDIVYVDVPGVDGGIAASVYPLGATGAVDLTIRSPSGELFAHNPVGERKISYPLAGAGRWAISVGSATGGAAVQLSVEVGGFALDAEVEPNGSFETATVVQRNFGGRFDEPGDVDWFELPVSPDAVLSADCWRWSSGSTAVPVELALFDASGAAIGAPSSWSMNHDGLTQGWLRVSGPSTASGATAWYACEVSVVPPPEMD